MSDPSPFDHRPDAELGEWLRDALTGTDQARFVAQLVQRLPARAADSWLDALGRWARPGVAAAAVLVVAAGIWLGSRPAEPVAETEPAVPRLDAGSLLASADLSQLDASLVLAEGYGDR